MNSLKRHGLPRQRRISRSADFVRLREEGSREVSGALIMNWAPAPSFRLGVVTSRKVGGSVVRSRARRLLREAFRLHQLEIKHPVTMVLVARPSIASRDFAGVERDYLKALARAGLRTALQS
jgi:ribonuclease P protein component